MSYREKEEKRMIIVEPHVQYRTLKAAEDTFTAIEIALNQLSMKDVSYIDDERASAILQKVLMFGAQQDEN